jgi:hypothetical protein
MFEKEVILCRDSFLVTNWLGLRRSDMVYPAWCAGVNIAIVTELDFSRPSNTKSHAIQVA